MIDPSRLYFFVLAALALLLVPGPAVLYITARSSSQGRMAGFVSVLAIETANLLQAVAAALGLSAILLSSALAFDVVKYLGAAYLVYLGIRKLFAADNQLGEEHPKKESLKRIYWQGFIVNIFNTNNFCRNSLTPAGEMSHCRLFCWESFLSVWQLSLTVCMRWQPFPLQTNWRATDIFKRVGSISRGWFISDLALQPR